MTKSKNIHKDKYDYSLVDYYKNARTKVKIICKKHGIFEQEPLNHFNKQGCPKCTNNKRYTTKEFIIRAKNIHGDKYDYSLVDYKNNITKVKIICPKHGEFEQVPSSHLSKTGCQKCAGNNKNNIQEFIDKSYKIHGDDFSYEKSIYKNAKSKLIIICKKHGEFNQRPNEHLSGKGCPICNKSKGEHKIENILKENNINFKTQYSFPDLKYKSTLYFDFGVLDTNNKLKCLIEYNGEQHYMFKSIFHKTENDFIISQHRDKLKRDYCIKYNIPLYIIKYNDVINTIEEIFKLNFNIY